MITENALQIFAVVYIVVSLLLFTEVVRREIKGGASQIILGDTLFIFCLCFFPFINLVILWDTSKEIFKGFFDYVLWERKEEITEEEQNNV